jgi:P22 coat protein - gene protein 5
MANSILSPSVIAKELLMQFKNGMGFSANVDKSYSKDFAKKGAKIGSSEKIRKPNRFTVTDGATYSAQDVTEDYVTLSIDTQKHVGFDFSSSELSLSIDDFSKRYLAPASLALVNKVDVDGLAMAAKNVANAVGTAATTPSALLTYLQAKQKIMESAGPQDDLYSYLVNPAASTSIVDALKSLFQSSDELNKQYKRGVMGIAAGGEWMISQSIYSSTSGQRGGTPLMNGATASGASTLVTDGWTAAAANRVKAGDVFSIANVYKVNPITKQSTGVLQQFVVTADAASDGSGNATLSISPTIYSSGSLQNVDALPADGAALSFVLGGASVGTSAVTAHNLLMHEQAFGLAFVPLEKPDGVHFAAVETDPDTGISIRVIRDYGFSTDKFQCRVDVHYGWAALRPEWACKILG